MVSECRYGANYGCLLSSTHCPGGDEHACELAVEGASPPEVTCRVPEGFPLGRKVAVPRRNAEKETVVVWELLHFENGIVGLGRRVHLFKYFF